jgi:LmbE family N-acetylglucosaminyl deacetylase
MVDGMSHHRHSPISTTSQRADRARIRVPRAAAGDVFAVVCELDRLPRWNDAISRVVTRPDRLAAGAEWTVAMRDGAMRWISRSTIVRYDPEAMVFVYRSGTDDGNPSYAEWRWAATQDGDDAVLEVGWRLHPRTALRQWVLAPYRARRLRREVPASLARLVAEFERGRHGAPAGGDSPTLLGVWAHPDDEAYLSAALMHRVRAAGGRVVVATATLGEAGLTSLPPDEAKAVRHGELQAALAAVGVDEYHVVGYADGGCSDVDADEAVARIEDLIRRVEPDTIVTFGPDGITGHPDHRAVSRWTIAAWQRVGRGELLLATMTDDFRVEHHDLHERLGVSMGDEMRSVPEDDVVVRVVPTAEEHAAKRRALDAHRSQTGPLAELMGYEELHQWWVDECFRHPTSADLHWAAFADAEARTT